MSQFVTPCHKLISRPPPFLTKRRKTIIGVEIRFYNFRLRKFGEVVAIPSQNETSDEIEKVNTSDNSTPSGEN